MTMMRMIAGDRSNFHGRSVDDVETKKIHKIVSDAILFGGTTNVCDFVPVLKWVWNRGFEKSLVELQKERVKFIQSLIEDNKTKMSSLESSDLSEETKKCMIQVLLSLQNSDPVYYRDEIIRGLMLVNFCTYT